ncbi:DUF1365 domain-containing protein [Alteromonas lipolytica]|uniref:DUF1365 domain-containing protein n=1 Tax=Alteromonas lipolytica TaxID=1856405 RepID=A0A1E8F9N0_9ALTE|nr:DUF1365 domain-containing protein [Alteromonas lipolytica]OFI32486.1 hypothetical protein BFC17_04790 [Alteromonas lipolytica]GGF75780.1 DUF1365 domain-containing protein [Alteromonas lipolytica]
MDSAICTGKVTHQRFRPTQHEFEYGIAMMWLNLDEVNLLARTVKGFSNTGRAAFEFRRSDYLGANDIPLKQAVLKKMNELASGQSLSGEVFLLGQARHFGLYFSPVNFYFLRNRQTGIFTYMLAEVSNTPWNERHYYLVDLSRQEDTPKAFHVSPFNPIDMVYKWHIQAPSDAFSVGLSCYKQNKHFTALMHLKLNPLNSNTIRNVIKSIPNMTLRTVIGIYWQAVKLWIKRTPVYSHPINSQE